MNFLSCCKLKKSFLPLSHNIWTERFEATPHQKIKIQPILSFFLFFFLCKDHIRVLTHHPQKYVSLLFISLENKYQTWTPTKPFSRAAFKKASNCVHEYVKHGFRIFSWPATSMPTWKFLKWGVFPSMFAECFLRVFFLPKIIQRIKSPRFILGESIFSTCLSSTT